MRGVDLGISNNRERSSRSMMAATGNKNNFQLELVDGKVDYESK